MSGLDSRYIIAPSLEMYFVDKDTGLPLSGGKVYFFQDEARSVPKAVYKIAGTPPNYSYDVLPNPSILSAVGTFQDDDGNDIIPYYFPFISNTDSTVQLYYVEVYDSNGVLQFTREGWPNFTSGTEPPPPSETNFDNFVPNGQFLLHNNIPATDSNDNNPGQVSEAVTIVAQGGWTYERPEGSNAVDIITFHRYSEYVQVPTANPRYAFQLQCSTVGSGPDNRKDLCLKFRDVNKFEVPNQLYNLYFEGQSATGSTVNGEVYILKYFGVGGSATPDPILQDTFTLNALSNTQVNITLNFENNEGETIGLGDDDYVQVLLRFPLNQTFTIQVTNFSITSGETNLDVFPVQTDAQQTAPSTAGWLPQPDADGFDLYLPIVFTASGFDFDNSEIGDVVASGNLSNFSGSICTNGNRLLADGSQYKFTDYSPLGIPYQRLGDYYADSGIGGVPQFGTGLNYATAYIEETSTSKLMFTTNKIAVVTPIADVNTTFTMKKLIDAAAGYGTAAYNNGDVLVTCIGLSVLSVLVTSVSAGTSGMTVNDIKNEIGSYYIFTATALTAAALGNGAGTGKYFDFSKDSATRYRMWFKTATETAPVDGGFTLVELDLDIGMTAKDVSKVLSSAISGFQDYQITCVAGSAVPAGSYFTFTANTQKYVVWYKVSDAGTEPVVANSIYIEVDILTGDTNVEVASKTQLAINAVYFAVPDLRGLFLRGVDPTGKWDIDYLSRFSVTNTLTGGLAGTLEYDAYGKHLHTGSLTDDTTQGGWQVPTAAGGGTIVGFFNAITNLGTAPSVKVTGKFISSSLVTANSGFSETRPVNSSVVWAVKY